MVLVLCLSFKPEPPYVQVGEPVSALSESEPTIEPVKKQKPVEQAEMKPEEPVKDPQGCEPERYWSETPPHDCIDKPVKTEVSTNKEQGSSTLNTNKTYSGNKQTWLAASGIPQSEWWAVDSIVTGESGWNPSAYNSSSGACGLGQQLPCGKWGGDWKDPVHALRSMNTYVQAYGGWAAAVEFRNCVGSCYSSRAGKYVDKDHTWY